MNETLQIILGLAFLAGVYMLTRMGVVWRLRRTSLQIVADLKRRGAVDTASAAALTYAKTDWLKIGLRDYRPKALEGLVNSGLVVMTPDGRYYLSQAGRELNV